MSSTDLITINELVGITLTPEVINSEDFGVKYALLLSTMKQLEDLKKTIDNEIKDNLQEQYLKTGNNKFSNGAYSYSYIPGTQRETVDSAKLKAEFPDVYKNCVKISPVKETVRINKIDKKEA